jgi:hypothetical protein
LKFNSSQQGIHLMLQDVYLLVRQASAHVGKNTQLEAQLQMNMLLPATVPQMMLGSTSTSM